MKTGSASHHVKSNIVLYGALIANICIAIAKFVAAGISGSSSMLTEGVHSVVDSGNQLLLLYGQARAKRPPDTRHPFGYGREIYFWAFVVAILLFAVGAVVSVYEGWQHILKPEPLSNPMLNYIVLGLAFLFEGTSWGIAIHEFDWSQSKLGWWKAIKHSKDPTGFVVLFEDSAALLGLIIAAVGVYASHATGNARIDGMASIAIGAVLGAVAILLAREAKGLLIGESADPDLVATIRRILEDRPEITAVNHVRTIYSAPDAIFVAVSADFDDSIAMGEGERLIEEMERALVATEPRLSSIYIRPEKHADASVEPQPSGG